MNNKRKDDNFRSHYQNIFGVRLPRQDTVSDVLTQTDPEELEGDRMDLMSNLFEQKILRPYRLLDQ
ncbi:MAG: hypothetical protein LBG45_02125 [Dysgonamonadaceae bacterium]|nr:hypothetical protein [Dysgonamonadaceae bacterium]